jgi:3-deoxy-manno-octulosonate cytidylyltransferase (CMP-KDO synthetase)
MILHVRERGLLADSGPVLVAAGDPEIADAVKKAGGDVVLTDPDLPSGSDRAFAAVEAFDPAKRYDTIINLQGDMPDLDPGAVKACLAALEETGADIATLAAAITNAADRDNPNVVKPAVAWDEKGEFGHAMYFSRARIPHGEGALFHHIGIYAYRRQTLARFVKLPPSPLEKREKLEQLRALEAGMTIAVARVDKVPTSIDTPEDLERARQLFSKARI